MRRVGVVGLGGMGLALVRALHGEGFPVTCYDLRPEAVASGEELGAVAVGSPRGCAEASDVVLTFLPGPTQVRQVALDPDDGVLVGLAPGAALLDLSTCGPDLALLLGQAFTDVGRRFVDCPVSRKAPDSTILVGGPEGVLGADEDVLSRVSRDLVHCGRLGGGYAVKLLNQHVKYTWHLASAEALVTAEALGLDPVSVASAIELCSGSDSGFNTAAKYFRDRPGVRAHAPASTIQKDLALAEAQAARAGVTSRSLAAAVDFFQHTGSTPYRDRPYPESTELLRSLRTLQPEIGSPE